MLQIKKMIAALVLLSPTSGLLAATEQTAGNNITISLNGMLALVAVILLMGIFSLGSTIKGILANNPNLFVKKEKLDNFTKSLILILLTGSSGVLFAAEPNEIATYPTLLRDHVFLILLVTDLILLFIFFQLFATSKKLIKALNPSVEPIAEIVNEEANTALLGIKLTDHVAIENEKDILLDHDYDGIQELDNNLPPWWVYMFYATIISSVFYIAWYHFTPYGVNQENEYLAEMEEGERQKEAYLAIAGSRVDESNVVFVEDAKNLAAGQEIYNANCVACHAADGGGGVGPNLTDKYWLHGGDIKDVFKVVKYGVPAKGMIPWQATLSPVEMQQVASYILTMQGSTPVKPKDPQGELYSPNNEEQNLEIEEGISENIK